jgi:hypothetical protein
MVKIVVIINTSIALMLFYAAWQLWQLKLHIAKITNWLIFVDRQTHALLDQAPEKIYLSQQNISQLRHKKKAIELQVQYLQQILYLIVWGQQIWQRYFWLTRFK